MTRSAEELEREVEATRSRVDHDVDALGGRMSPGQLVDELMRSLRGSSSSDMLLNLGRQVRENPLPLALVGAGLVWLMMGAGVRRGDHGSRTYEPVYSGGAPQPGEDRYSMPGAAPGGDSGRSSSSSAAARASSRATSGAAHAGRSATRYGRRAQRSFFDVVENEPLVIGAIGLAVGAAIGAVLPVTRTEERQIERLRYRSPERGARGV